MAKYDLDDGDYNGSGARIGIAASRFNQHLVSKLLDGALETLTRHGVAEDDIDMVRVPGAFELPVAALQLAKRGDVDAVICIGAVVRGDTPHFEFVAGECARGLQDAALATEVPVIFGVITTNTEQQALDRCGGREGNKGAEAAMAALEMRNALQSISRG
ncbi:MAG: 6,7-dimethyl-8-ribityllumazine synthase [Pseudomonadota bacterium]